ncbi:MAG: LamG domain-containing protein [Candidatus Poribacteria bacterium]|nr:LamG domain-containing protein [Candidatus Poribacteria bacterium]
MKMLNIGCIATLLLAASTAFAQTDGLVGYWGFDGNGASAVDGSGNGHNGQFKGNAKRGDGKYGGGIELFAPLDYVLVPHHDDFNRVEEVTYMAWFSPSADLTSQRLLSKNNAIFIMFDIGNTLTADFLVKAPDNVQVESTTTVWDIGEWYHLAGAYDGDSLRMYINGVMEGEAPCPNAIVTSDLDLWIGADDFGRATDWFPGRIDEVRVYDRALSDGEIVTAMGSPLAVNPGGLLSTVWGAIKTR